MTTAHHRPIPILICVMALLIAGAGAQAANQYWTNTAGGVWSTTGNWVTAAPSGTDVAYFTNNQPSAYTVTFTANATEGKLNVINDSVIFDLAGKTLTNYQTTATGLSYLGTNAAPVKVTFTSTGSPGTVYYATDYSNRLQLDGAGTVITITNVNVTSPEARVGPGVTVNVLGPNAQWYITTGGNYDHLAGTNNVLNGAKATFGYLLGSYSGNALIICSNGSSMAGGANVGWGGDTTVKLYANSTWRNASLVLGANNLAGNYNADILLDQSSLNADTMTWGGGMPYYGNANETYNPSARVIAQNGSSVVVSNGYLLIYGGRSLFSGLFYTNAYTLANSTILIGKPGVNGVITNLGGVLHASGTISGQGAGNFLFDNAVYKAASGWTSPAALYVGNSPGTLTLNKGNLQCETNTLTYFQFSNTALSQIVATNGFVHLFGTNLFSLASGAPNPVPGVKYGLGIYDFVIATDSNINRFAQYDNLVNLLTNTYHLTYGVDFQYGVVSLGGGLFALELTFVPEPSTVLLLALGGLMVWRRLAKGRRKVGKVTATIVASALILALVGGGARADTTNYWQSSGGYSGSYGDSAHWSLGAAPTATTWLEFTNNQLSSSPYTVTFTGNAVNGPLNVFKDSVIFDLQGHTWTNSSIGSSYLGTNNAAPTITFTSSSGGPGSVAIAPNGSSIGWIGVSSMTITNCKVSVGYDTYFNYNGAPQVNGPNVINVLGPGAEFDAYRGGSYYNAAGTITVVNAATAVLPNIIGSYAGPDALVMVSNGSTLGAQGSTTMGWGMSATVKILSNSTWRAGSSLYVGDNQLYSSSPYNGDALIDQSTAFADAVQVGWASSGFYGANGRLTIQNGSTMTISNGWLLVENGSGLRGGVTYTNKMVLSNSTIYFGNSTHNGAITNRGLMSASGTITGRGAGNFLLRNEQRLDVGNSPGVLTLNKGNLELAANSQTYFQFSDTALSQIKAQNGYASLLGTNLFSLAAAASAPVHGVKYGLGVYDFVIATNINRTPQYDNLVNLLTNSYHLTYGVDFQYGVVSLGGGLFALELAFVPEPSTVMLLALGGLLVWRRIVKRHTK